MPLLLQIGPQCHAFIAGVASVIPLQWFQLFDEREIQVLISGAEVAINVEDLMVNIHALLRYVPTCVRCEEITVLCFSVPNGVTVYFIHVLLRYMHLQ